MWTVKVPQPPRGRNQTPTDSGLFYWNFQRFLPVRTRAFTPLEHELVGRPAMQGKPFRKSPEFIAARIVPQHHKLDI
jgi:hypothetical protein